jgi:hypothetical protein
MQLAMRHVEAACSADMSTLCPSPEQLAIRRAPIVRLGAPRDPIMEFLTNPMAPPPMMMDLSTVLDQMVTEAIQMSDGRPHLTIFRVVDMPADNEQPAEKPAPEELLDSMVKNLVQRSSEKPEVVTQKIVEHANDLLKTEQDGDRVRLARRLTELSPGMFRGPPLPLPFGCPRNRCLMAAYEQGVTSQPCSDALKAAEGVRNVVVMRESIKVERDSKVFLTFTMLYGVLAFVTLAVLSKHLKKMHRRIEYQVNLKKSILQAVYSNPAIKAKVEASMGKGIGYVPPLPPHVLAKMGGHEFPHRGFFCLKIIKAATFAAVLTLVFVNPVLAMPVLCIFVFARFIHLAFCPPQIPDPMCSCCCCGLSTDDVKNGNVSAEQACCTCCNAMGVCAPGCSDCCGLEPDGACDCCSDGCNCCNPPPVCCCCGASPQMKTLTAEQSKCSCCKGTGLCADGCKSCCGDETGCDCCTGGCDCCKGDNSASACTKPLLRADQGIYQGIPIQIV